MTPDATVASLVTVAAGRLRDAGFSQTDARQDATVLARGVLHWTLADWLARRHTQPPPAFADRLRALVDRRATREPVAYLLGEKEFYGRSFVVTPDTLIPRPETEGLVDQALTWLARQSPAQDDPSRIRVVDVGTGSGCIAVTVALECRREDIDVTATDVSAPALAVAETNRTRLAATSVRLVRTNLLDGIAPGVALVVSNPPYVPVADREHMSPDVVRFEPGGALFAGAEGLDVIRQLAADARRVLRPGGALMMEIGIGQSAAVSETLTTVGFVDLACHADLQGIPRVVVAHTPIA